MVQAGQNADVREAALRSELETFSQNAFGEPPDILWVVVPEKSGFTEAIPSKTSFVVFQSNKKLVQETRVDLLKGICEFWMNETGCAIDDVVAVINDPDEE